MNFIKKLFKKKPMTEFSKWVVRTVVKVYIFIVAYSVIIISVEAYIAYKSIGNYNSVTIDLPSLIELGKESLLALITYICAAAFVNRKKIDKGYDPNYDDKFKEKEM